MPWAGGRVDEEELVLDVETDELVELTELEVLDIELEVLDTEVLETEVELVEIEVELEVLLIEVLLVEVVVGPWNRLWTGMMLLFYLRN
jgi:hypothetical protein